MYSISIKVFTHKLSIMFYFNIKNSIMIFDQLKI